MRRHIVIASSRPGRIGPTIAEWFAAQVTAVGLPMLDEPHHPAERHYLHEHTRLRRAIVADSTKLAS